MSDGPNYTDDDALKAANVLVREARYAMDNGWLDKADVALTMSISLLEGAGGDVGPSDPPKDLPADYFREVYDEAKADAREDMRDELSDETTTEGENA